MPGRAIMNRQGETPKQHRTPGSSAQLLLGKDDPPHDYMMMRIAKRKPTPAKQDIQTGEPEMLKIKIILVAQVVTGRGTKSVLLPMTDEQVLTVDVT